MLMEGAWPHVSGRGRRGTSGYAPIEKSIARIPTTRLYGHLTAVTETGHRGTLTLTTVLVYRYWVQVCAIRHPDPVPVTRTAPKD
jgi:hypothetical protein